MTSSSRWAPALCFALAACSHDVPTPVAEPVDSAPGAAARIAPLAPTSASTPTSALEPSASASAVATATAAPAAEDDVAPERAWPAGYSPPEIWEEKKVVIDGVTETWSLRWRKKPRFNGCDPGMGCGCDGLTWGLAGDLQLVRERPGAPTERLDLGEVHSRFEPRFEGQGPGERVASIPGFQRTPHDDGLYDKAGKELRPAERRMTEIVKRKHVEVMKLGDYDHDGIAAEFVFQVGYLACGQNPSVLVGVSRDDMHLHAFGITMIYRAEWDRILAARGKSVDLELHACGDHGGGGDYATVIFDPVKGMRLVDDPKWECLFDDKTGFQKRRKKPR